MPHGKTKFQENWLEKELDGVFIKEWCCMATNNIYFAKCNLCVEQFDISSSGFAQLKSHHKGKKHKIKFDPRFKNKSISQAFQQKVNCNEGSALSHDMQVTKAETLWALIVAESNLSFKCCTEIVNLFKEMFPDSIIASGMQLKEKKVAYVICHGIYKSFQELLKKDLSSCSTNFTIAFDETTNAQVKRQLDVYARYWSSDLNLVTCRYLASVFLGHATADIILRELLDVLSSFNISLNNIICLSMDNPNVNKSLLRKFNEKMKDEYGKETVSLGACNLHVANNSFKYLLNEIALDGISFDEFATDVHFFLKYSAARREDYQSMEEVTEETSKFFFKHVGSRWLTTGLVAERLLDQWGNMCEYFLKFLPSQKSQKHLNTERYRRICAALKNPVMPSFLAFLIFTHKYFESFSVFFQSESPKIHVLYEEINNLIRSVMAQVLKDSIVGKKEGNDLQVIKLDDKDNWKKLNDIEIGMRAKNFIQKVSENDKKLFLMCVRKALFSTINYMRTNFPYCHQILKDMDIFKPLDIHKHINHGLHAITRIAQYLHFSENAIDNIREEWKLLKCDDQAQKILSQNSDSRIDVYWHSLESVTNSNKEIKYRNLLNLIKTALILPHGNADPERGFSINKSMLKGSFNENTITSLRFVKDTIKNYGGVSNVPITTSLLNDVKNSHKAYQQYMEKQKEIEQKLMKEKRKNENDNSERQANLKRKYEMDKKINEIDAEICHIKEEKNIAIGLIAEGTERLLKSISEKNNVETTVASALISQATEQLKKLEAKLSEIETEKAQILKKRIKCETK